MTTSYAAVQPLCISFQTLHFLKRPIPAEPHSLPGQQVRLPYIRIYTKKDARPVGGMGISAFSANFSWLRNFFKAYQQQVPRYKKAPYSGVVGAFHQRSATGA